MWELSLSLGVTHQIGAVLLVGCLGGRNAGNLLGILSYRLNIVSHLLPKVAGALIISSNFNLAIYWAFILEPA